MSRAPLSFLPRQLGIDAARSRTTSPHRSPSYRRLRLHRRHDRSISAEAISRSFWKCRVAWSSGSIKTCATGGLKSIMEVFFGRPIQECCMVRIRTIVLAALLLPSLACAAQIPGLPSKPAAKSTPSASAAADPLGRGTPHGTVLGFLHAAQAENYSVAAQYFQPATGHRRLDPTEEQDLAAQLLAVINQKILASSLESLSDDPQGRLDDGLPPNQELLTGVRESNGVFFIELLRLDDDHGNKLWYISRKTLVTIPETYDSLQFSDIEKKLPSYLTKHRFLSMPLWQWIAILVALPLAVVAGWVLSLLPRMATRYYRKKLDPAAGPGRSLFHIGPGTLLLAALVHYLF